MTVIPGALTMAEFKGILVSATKPVGPDTAVILETKETSYELVLSDAAKLSVPYFVNTEQKVLVIGELLPHDRNLYVQRIKAETIHEIAD